MNSNTTARVRAPLTAALIAAMLTLGVGTAQAGNLSVSSEIMLDAAPETVWALVGNFKGLERWHPAVATSTADGSGQEAGDTRVLTLGDGGEIKEELAGYEDDAMTYEYAITDSPLPVANYQSSISVESAGEGKSKVTWQSTFDAEGAEDAKAREVISGVYKGGLEQLAQYYNEK